MVVRVATFTSMSDDICCLLNTSESREQRLHLTDDQFAWPPSFSNVHTNVEVQGTVSELARHQMFRLWESSLRWRYYSFNSESWYVPCEPCRETRYWKRDWEHWSVWSCTYVNNRNISILRWTTGWKSYLTHHRLCQNCSIECLCEWSMFHRYTWRQSYRHILQS